MTESFERAPTHLLARVEAYELAIPIASVISVHAAPLLFSVPGVQPGIAGAVHFEGRMIPVFDLRRALRLTNKSVEATDLVIFIDTGSAAIAAFFDEVSEFVTLPLQPEAASGSIFGDSRVNANIIAGIACSPRLCAIVDPAGLLVPDRWDADPELPLYQRPNDASHPLWARTQALAAVPDAPEKAGIEAALFTIGAQRYAVAICDVVGFFSEEPHSPVPARGQVAVSLLNRKGEALVLLDPRPLMGSAPQPFPALVQGVELRAADQKLAIPVDSLEGLTRLATSDAMPRPSALFAAAYRSDAGPVLLLDVPALLHSAQSAFSHSAAAA
jgi:chemotaxis signal transduction protein